MIRKALLIGCPGDEGDDDYLAGVVADINKFYSYLLSYTGGAWEHREIMIFTNPTEDEVIDAMNSMQRVDYSFIYFSGHGSYQDGQTYLYINGSNISENQLISKVKRQLLIIDCCRLFIESNISGAVILEEIAKAYDPEREKMREIFDRLVMLSEIGLVRVHAANINEAANEDEEGGYFTQSLLKAGAKFGEMAGSNYGLLINGAFKVAKEHMEKHYPTIQTPKFYGGRRLRYFPFAVRSQIIVKG